LSKQSKDQKGWEETLFDDLEGLDDIPRFLALGEAISRINPVLSRLAAQRREVAMRLIESGQYSYSELAATVGFRVQTVRRLVDEGRAQRRTEELEEDLDEAA
jgi:DNA-directed RNA polymerase specialized sigma24 family protein